MQKKLITLDKLFSTFSNTIEIRFIFTKAKGEAA